jgi:hypothetical protein
MRTSGSVQAGHGLDFEASQPVVTVDDVKLDVRMDQRGCSIELRGQDGQLLRRWTGREVSRAAESGELNVRQPALLKESAWRAWHAGRPKPAAPAVYRLDLRDADVAQTIGRLKLLIDWLTLHVDDDISIDPVAHEEPAESPAQSNLGLTEPAQQHEPVPPTPGSTINRHDQPAEHVEPRSGVGPRAGQG